MTLQWLVSVRVRVMWLYMTGGLGNGHYAVRSADDSTHQRSHAAWIGGRHYLLHHTATGSTR